MSEVNDHSSDSGSDINWPLENPFERISNEQVLFENVADQYVKGDDVTVFFTILNDAKINAEQDHIGLTRIGSTNIKECLAYVPVQITPSTASGSNRHGTATFSSASLPDTDDEFYQFCYVINKSKSLGSSLPFQLNCSLGDIDLLSNGSGSKLNGGHLVTVADDDMVVIETKRMLTEEKLRQENRQLLDIRRQLELQKEELQAKLDSFQVKTTEHIAKSNNDMQALAASHKAAITELTSRQRSESKLLTEYDACRVLCEQYQKESLQHAERCRTLESAHEQIINDTNQIRSQLAVTSQFTKDQATQIIDLERRLMQSNELSKISNQRQAKLEQELRDLRLTSEKYQMSAQAQLESQATHANDQKRHIDLLEMSNSLLKEDNERLINMSKQDKKLSQDLQEQMNQLREEQRVENESAGAEMETLRAALHEMNSNHDANLALKTSMAQIEKRCVKHQKSELEAKKQLNAHKNFIEDLQREIQELTNRLAAGADEYKTLFRQYTALERKMDQPQSEQKPNTTTLSHETGLNEEALVSLLRSSYEIQQQLVNPVENDEPKNIPLVVQDDHEVDECPVCHWEFPSHMTVDNKREHIEFHFE